MLRTSRSVGAVLATLTPLVAIATGELALQYDDSKKVAYAKRQLLASSVPPSESDAKPSETGASAWLGSAPPKFPYLLSVSAGDNPGIVTNALLGGARVLGSYEEPTRDTLERLTEPTSALESLIHKIARRYAEFKTSLHGDVPVDFDPRAGLQASAEGKMMDALLSALREIHSDEDAYNQESHGENNAGAPSDAAQQKPDHANAIPVFFLRDFDTLGGQTTERWLRWTYQMTSEGLAHVVLLTTLTVTPSRVQWLQARHQSGIRAAGPNESQDFVAILLRPANSLVDPSSAKDKLQEISAKHDLKLFPKQEGDVQEYVEHQSDVELATSDVSAKDRAVEVDLVVKTTGNWWSDIDEICRRLKESDLNEVTRHDDRVAMVQKICDGYLHDIEVGLLEVLNLDGSLDLRNAALHGAHTLLQDTPVPANESQALSALEAWKCLETLSDVTPATGGNALMGSPQRLLQQQKDEKPLNCASPVDALLPFNYREEGEQKFLDMVDRQVLFLRPKDAIEIGVIPCKKAELVSPCWVQIRPVMKKAFEKIHRNDAYFNVVLDLERFAANTEMRKEVDLYEQEIAESRQFLHKSKSEFAILQFTMKPAEKAQRKAELALIQVELQAKDVYLEKLRSLLSP